MDGLAWKTQWKKEPVAYGVFKIQIGAIIEDAKVSADEYSKYKVWTNNSKTIVVYLQRFHYNKTFSNIF